MADGAGGRAGSREILSRGHGALRQRAFVFAEQHTGAIPWSEVSGRDGPGQRGGGAPASSRPGHCSSPRNYRFFDGSGAGVPVGGELSRLQRPDRGHVRHREVLAPWCGAARRPDRRDHARSGVQGRRLHGPAQAGGRALRTGLGRLALLAGVVAAGALAKDHAAGHDVRVVRDRAADEFHSGRRRERPDPPGAHLGAARCGDYEGVRRQPGESVGVDQGAGALHAVGDRSLLSGLRRALRGAVHSPRHPHADSVSLGSSRGSGDGSRGSEVPQ
jgi:hypothetical protein